jgi:hypothetical protein
MNSRYPKPGSSVACYVDYPSKWGMAIILATSRHKATYPEESASERLVKMYAADGATVEIERATWRSVVAADLEMIEATPGDWHSEGSGAAWVEVLSGFPTYADEADR